MNARNLIFVRAGDNSLHRSWAIPRSLRNYDLFVSYYGDTVGTFQNEGEYYEAVSGLKYPRLGQIVSSHRELFDSYDAIWVPDDDLLIGPDSLNEMFEIFHRHKLLLAQPALMPQGYWSHRVTVRVRHCKLHFTRFVEVMCPIFHSSILHKLAPTFTMSASTWGMDYLWGKRLGYPSKQIAVIDQTPALHTRPVGNGALYENLPGKTEQAVEEAAQLAQEHKINVQPLRSKIYGSVAARPIKRSALENVFSLYNSMQRRIDPHSKFPVFYEDRHTSLAKQRKSPRKRRLFPTPQDTPTMPDQERTEVVKGELALIAEDIVQHWSSRRTMRLGKALVVCKDSKSAAALLSEIHRIYPEGASTVALAEGGNGSGQSADIEELKTRFRDAKDPLELVIVADINRTDFDAPTLTTLYVNVPVPVEQHVSMACRVMRMFEGRLAPLVIDYAGLSSFSHPRKQETSPSLFNRRVRKPKSALLQDSKQTPRGAISSFNAPFIAGASGVQQRIAHLFLVRNNLNHENIWSAFFKESEGLAHIYVHAKEPHNVTSATLQGKGLARTCETKYGHVSLVEAELLLLQAALQEPTNSFFLLHSESCVPIRPFKYIYHKLTSDGRSRMGYFKGDLWRYYGVNPTAIPFDCYFKASQFFCLNRAHAQLVVERGNLSDWQNSDCPDEHFVPTLLAMHGQLHECVCERRPNSAAGGAPIVRRPGQ